MSAVTTWSRTAASNNSASPNGAPEGWAPSAVNDWARETMKAVVDEAAKGQCKVLASVSGSTTITASMTPDLDAYAAGMMVVFTPVGSNTGATTLNIDSLGALDVLKSEGDALLAGDLVTGVPAVLVLDSGADDWILLNPQSLSNTAGGTGAAAEEVGFRGLPERSSSADYTLILSDAGKHITHPSGAGSDVFTIPANSSVAFPVGTVVTFINLDSTALSIAITTDTLTLAGTTTTGTRTLAQNGIATAVKVASTSWLISGTGLS